MSEVTITIVVRAPGDVVAVSTNGEALAGGPAPQLLAGAASTDAGSLPVPTISPDTGTDSGPPTPTIPAQAAMGGAGPIPAPVDLLRPPGGMPTDVPPSPEVMPATGGQVPPE